MRETRPFAYGLSIDHEQAVNGEVRRRLVGHHHIVEDLDLSSDGQYALSDRGIAPCGKNGKFPRNKFRRTGFVANVIRSRLKWCFSRPIMRKTPF